MSRTVGRRREFLPQFPSFRASLKDPLARCYRHLDHGRRNDFGYQVSEVCLYPSLVAFTSRLFCSSPCLPPSSGLSLALRSLRSLRTPNKEQKAPSRSYEFLSAAVRVVTSGRADEEHRFRVAVPGTTACSLCL